MRGSYFGLFSNLNPIVSIFSQEIVVLLNLNNW